MWIRHCVRWFGRSSSSRIRSELDVRSTDEVSFERLNAGLRVTLTRPKALNALNLSMVRTLYPVYQACEKTDLVQMILLRGQGEKAFCAGGDIKAIWSAGKDKSGLERDFFREEYLLNYCIATMKTVHVALLDGITMGGGVGLSVHGPIRVATERSVFAMPETAIGFFPDVGGTYFLSRLPDSLGMYLALTGARLKGSELKKFGIATHCVPSQRLPELEEQLLNLPYESLQDAEVSRHVLYNYITDFEGPEEESPLDAKLPLIREIFSRSSVEDIFHALHERADSDPWCKRTHETLSSMSPTSLKITFEQIRRGSTLSYEDCFKLEYRISQHLMEENDFFEGVRSLLIDKDNSPKWKPDSIYHVDSNHVEKFFAPLPADRELVLPSL